MQAPQLWQPGNWQSLAIVFCDIVGTTPLTAQQGDLVTSTVLHDFMKYSSRLCEEYHSVFIKFVYNGFLTAFEFDKIIDILAFARSLQDLQWMNGRGLSCRFSLHFGDALCTETSYGKDLFGEDVNLVARLNDLAEPGQIVISHDTLRRMPAEQQALASPSETARVKASGEVQIHRIDLSAGDAQIHRIDLTAS